MKDDILENSMMLLPKTISAISEDYLSLYVDIVYQRILNYCNRSDFPEQLKYVASQMVVDYVTESYGKFENTPIASISEDGRSVSFDYEAYSTYIDDRISKTNELNRFKKLYRVDK